MGDIVKLSSNAVYYNGTAIPDWVKTDQWVVASVSGDRVLIDKNVDGSHQICSPVNVTYLISMSEKQEQDNSEQEVAAKILPVQPAADVSTGEMTISDKGVELIAAYEGCRLEAYKCPAGVWTIGYGHTQGVKPDDRLSSQEEAKKLLREDLQKYGGYVNTCVSKGVIQFKLNQNQFDALTSFCYNCGYGSLQKLVAGGDAQTVAEKMLLYNKGAGKVLPGLVRRREEERALFLKA